MAKLKIILGFLVLIIGLIGGGYFYLNKMTVQTGNININKTNPIDKLCNYTIFSDFYYHIIDYEHGGNSFSQLTPIKTDICYDFKKREIELKPNITDEYIILEDRKGDKVAKKIRLLENFQTEYAKIVATQDSDYFTKSYELAQKTYNTLYGEALPMKAKSVSEYYTNISNLPIDNLVVNYFKLQNITKQPLQATKEGGWQPNILEWDFGEKDKIYLQYLTQSKSNDLDEYINNKYSKTDKIVVKFTKFNNNTLNKMFLIFSDKQNKVTALFMDINGYIYNLTLKVQNKKAFDRYFNDFIKISYGISFKNIDGIVKVNQWAKNQDNVEVYYDDIVSTVYSIANLYSKSTCPNILTKYKEFNFLNDFFSWSDEFVVMNNLVFDEKYKFFKNKYGTYPNEEIVRKFLNTQKNLELVLEGVDALTILVPWPKDGCEILQDNCNTLQCVKNLKAYNWELVD